MRSLMLGAAVVVASLFLGVNSSRAQAQKVLMPAKGWGSLSGTVTLGKNTPTPVPADLKDTIKGNRDAACCLEGKPAQLVDETWVVDAKTRGVANVVLWLKAPEGQYFPISEEKKKRTDQVVIDQPNCAFIPRISTIQPTYWWGGKDIPTGQKVLIKNSAVVNHNVRMLGHPDRNPGINKNMPAKSDLDLSDIFKSQLLPISMNCDFHPWMTGKLFVFDHPYYAITKADGSFEMPMVPAGAEVSVIAWHEGKGWVLPELKQGRKIVLKEGKNTLNIEYEMK